MTHAVATQAMIPAAGGKIINVTLSPHHGLPGMAHSAGGARGGREHDPHAVDRVGALQHPAHRDRLRPLRHRGVAKYPRPVYEGVARTVPARAPGRPEEQAWLVAYLASPAGDYHSGSVITIDGARDNWLGPWPPPAADRRGWAAARRGAAAEANGRGGRSIRARAAGPSEHATRVSGWALRWTDRLVSPAKPKHCPLEGSTRCLPSATEACCWRRASARCALVEPVSEADMDRVHDPLMSPLVWDLGHIAAFEDLWACQRAGGLPGGRPRPRRHLRRGRDAAPQRGDAPYLRLAEAHEYMDDRARADAAGARRQRPLGRGGRPQPGGDGVGAGAAARAPAQRDHAPDARAGRARAYSPRRRMAARRRRSTAPATRGFGSRRGRSRWGSGPERFAYDNERPRHEVEVEAFEIDASR